ncbi:MAG: hypothetical protein LPK18_01605 [Pseudomonadaceae bacterium]|nr:hypothetical protein [Pseudomonadaceae bacterium]
MVERELELAVPILCRIGLFQLFSPEEWMAAADNPGRRFVGRKAREYLG